MRFHLTPRAFARAPFRVAVSVATAAAILAAGGFMALPHPGASAIATAADETLTVAPTVIAAVAPQPHRALPADLTCLAKAVYYEARGESAEGQAAVAQVVLNRTRHPTYPPNVCAVVYQGVDNGGCQFSFVCDGAMRRPIEPAAWTRARRVAFDALRGHVMNAVGSAVSFHVASGSGRQGEIARIGSHVFFAVGGGHVSHRPREAPQVAEIAPSADTRGVDASTVATPSLVE